MENLRKIQENVQWIIFFAIHFIYWIFNFDKKKKEVKMEVMIDKKNYTLFKFLSEFIATQLQWIE